MKIGKSIAPRGRTSWRRWLEKNHASRSEIWVVFFRMGSGKQGLALDAAVEEALCFGWIDGILKKLDDERYALRFSPRRPGSNWAASNIQRARRLTAEGRMTEAGLAMMDPRILQDESSSRQYQTKLSPNLESDLKRNKPAWETFQRLAPSHQRQYIGWIMDAKREETRRRRLQEAISKLEKGKPLGVK